MSRQTSFWTRSIVDGFGILIARLKVRLKARLKAQLETIWVLKVLKVRDSIKVF